MKESYKLAVKKLEDLVGKTGLLTVLLDAQQAMALLVNLVAIGLRSRASLEMASVSIANAFSPGCINGYFGESVSGGSLSHSGSLTTGKVY